MAKSSFGVFLERVIRKKEQQMGIWNTRFWNPDIKPGEVLELDEWCAKVMPPDDGKQWLTTKRNDGGRRLGQLLEIDVILQILPALPEEGVPKERAVLTVKEKYLAKVCKLDYSLSTIVTDPWTGNKSWSSQQVSPKVTRIRARIRGMRNRIGFKEMQEVCAWFNVEQRSYRDVGNSEHFWKYIRRPYRWDTLAKFIDAEMSIEGKSDAEVEAMLLAVSL